jgi:hypothetical protein
MSRFDRFRRLEAPRTERAGEGGKKTRERFDRVEEERAPGEAPPSPRPSTQRVERQVSDQPLALDTRPKEEQQFIRCMRCEGDSSRYAAACVHCGASLQTDEQRDYNERFWRQRLREVAQEKEAVAQFHQHREQLSDEHMRVQREAFSQMVRESQHGGGSSGQPWGIRLINSIKDPIWQWVLIGTFAAVGIGAGLGLWRSRMDQLGLKGVCLGALIGLAFLFTPPSLWVRRRRRGWFNDHDDWL